MSFTYNNLAYKLYVVKNSQGVKVLVGTGTGTPKPLTADKFNNQIVGSATADFTALVNAGTAMATATSPSTMANGQAGVTAAENVVKNDILAGACTALNACFAAGTKLWTPQGYEMWRTSNPTNGFEPRHENDPFGAIVAKLVEEKFERKGRILHLHLSDGKVIRTTPELTHL